MDKREKTLDEFFRNNDPATKRKEEKAKVNKNLLS